MADSNEYTALIAGHWAQKEKFQQWIFTLTEPFRIARERFVQMAVESFDLDKSVGAQLDAVGARIGLARGLPIAIPDVFFALDDVDGIGLDLGVWLTKLDTTTTLVTMGDNVYRMALKAKVQLNHYDGTLESVTNVLRELFAAFDSEGAFIDVIDNQDMNFIVNVVKDDANPILLALIENRFLDMIAAGVGGFLVDTLSVELVYTVGAAILLVGAVLFGASNRIKA
jgi:hypothetical protein